MKAGPAPQCSLPRLKLELCGKAVRLSGQLGTFSVYHPDRFFTGFSWDCLSTTGILLPAPPEQILLLGMGGGTVIRQCRLLYPAARIDAVEIDRDVVRLARRHFHLPRARLRVFVADSARFLRDTRDCYDMILDDVWVDDPRFIKPLFADPSYVRVSSRRLTSHGIYAINLWCRPGRASEIASAAKLLRSFFSGLIALRPRFGPTAVLAALRRPDVDATTRRMLWRQYSIHTHQLRIRS